jgi:hypothetical protein
VGALELHLHGGCPRHRARDPARPRQRRTESARGPERPWRSLGWPHARVANHVTTTAARLRHHPARLRA